MESYAAAGGKVTTLNGPSVGNAVIQGSKLADLLTAYGQHNTIYSNGGDDTINAGAVTAAVYTGSGKVATNLQGTGDIVVGGDGNNTVSGSTGSANVTLGTGVNSVTLGGAGNVVSVGAGIDFLATGSGHASVILNGAAATVALGGTGNFVTQTGGAAVINGGQGGDTINVNGGLDTITTAGAGSRVALSGSILANINDQGSGLHIDISSSSQVDFLTGFGSKDTTGVIAFHNHVGGFSSVGDVMAALHNDGHGGTMISLRGSYGGPPGRPP